MTNCISLHSFLNLPKVIVTSLFLVCIVPNTLYAQKVKQDSLEHILEKKNLPVEEKILTLSRLATHHYFNDNREESIRLLSEASQLAKNLEDKQFFSRILAIQAMHLRIEGDSTAKTIIKSALNNLPESATPSNKGYIWYAKGWMESRDNLLTEAVTSFIEALRHYEKSSDENDIKTISGIYVELYSIYGQWRDLDNMEKYARLALDNALKSGNPDELSAGLYSIAYTFEDRFRAENSRQMFRDSAEYYYKQSIATLLAHEDRITNRNQLPFNALGLANLYSEFYPISYKDSARHYLDIALDQGLKTNHYTVVTGVYGILNEYAQRENRWSDAEYYLNQAVAYQEKNPMPELETKIRLMEALAFVAEKNDDHPAALEYYKQYLSYYQQRFDNEKMVLGKELEVKYKTELNEQRLEMLEEQVAHRKKLNFIYILLSVTIFIALVFLLIAYRQRSKTMKHQQLVHEMELKNIRQEHEISLLSAMIDGQENERARIARDLHDGLGGLLSGIKIELSGGTSDSAAPNTQELIRSSLNRIDQAVDELRRISRNMMPEILLQYGLEEALKEYCQSLKRSGVNITCQVFNFQNNLSKNKQVIVYRIAQELINNAVKYAQSSHILVELRQQSDSLLLTVEDDGIGFDTKLAKQKKGSGLQNIEARAIFLNGSIQTESTAETGTATVLQCPV